MSRKSQIAKPALEPFDVDKFPGLAQAAKTFDEKRGTRYQQHLLTALNALNEGMETRNIRNVVYNDVKHTLGTLLSKHYSDDVRDKMRARESEWNIDTRKIMSSILMSSLTDVKSATNKLNKIKQSGLNFDELHTFIKTHSPLVEAVDFLKGHIVKGRAPSAAPAEPVNPNKVVKTCPCCFRQIAVRNDKMVHHGFERPGYGYQTQSCWGIRFAPLETSLEGLSWLIDLKTERLADRRDSLKKLPKRMSSF